MPLQLVRHDLAQSVEDRKLPPIPKGLGKDQCTTIVLFYQYIEPPWTPQEHREAMSKITAIGRENSITGRGRVAPEGVNCTLTGSPENVRNFCYGLRAWQEVFNKTDFKLTDGLTKKQCFKVLTLRKTEELVGYNLPGLMAPSLKENKAKHLPADEYHKMMAEPDTVIIDVRNFYESNIGHFAPPKGGAKLLDPKMRNSNEFPKWLEEPEVQKELDGKKVMMYCTGGIRCERASALLTEMAEVTSAFKPKDVVMVKGGIERYLKTFPEGGYWKGNNYLFDRRMEQTAELSKTAQEQVETDSYCSLCKTPWAWYRGKNICAAAKCKVPVIVCVNCKDEAAASPHKLFCPLCEAGTEFKHLSKPTAWQDASQAEEAILQKRKMQQQRETAAAKKRKTSSGPSTRLFLGKLPLLVSASQIQEALGEGVKLIHWLVDHKSKLFYGSAFVEMESLKLAQQAVDREASIREILGKRVLISFSEPKDGQEWPPADHKPTERPVIPLNA